MHAIEHVLAVLLFALQAPHMPSSAIATCLSHSGWKGNIKSHEGILPVAYATACSDGVPLRAADTPRAPCPAIAPCLAQ